MFSPSLPDTEPHALRPIVFVYGSFIDAFAAFIRPGEVENKAGLHAI